MTSTYEWLPTLRLTIRAGEDLFLEVPFHNDKNIFTQIVLLSCFVIVTLFMMRHQHELNINIKFLDFHYL